MCLLWLRNIKHPSSWDSRPSRGLVGHSWPLPPFYFPCTISSACDRSLWKVPFPPLCSTLNSDPGPLPCTPYTWCVAQGIGHSLPPVDVCWIDCHWSGLPGASCTRLFQFHIQWPYVRCLKSTMVGIFAPQKSAVASNNRFLSPGELVIKFTSTHW